MCGRVILLLSTQEEWLNCQRNWLYLESIFSAPDIQHQLPNEAKMFIQVDKSWKDIMRRVQKMPVCIRAATQPGKERGKMESWSSVSTSSEFESGFCPQFLPQHARTAMVMVFNQIQCFYNFLTCHQEVSHQHLSILPFKPLAQSLIT